MLEKLFKFIVKTIFTAYLFFSMYILTFLGSVKLADYIGVMTNSITPNSLNWFIICILLSSGLALLLTFIIHLLSAIIWNSSAFFKWFKIANLLYLYLSGLFSAIDAMQPLLIRERILIKEIDSLYKFAYILFFVALFNYTFYENISKKFDVDNFFIIKIIKRIPNNIKKIINKYN